MLSLFAGIVVAVLILMALGDIMLHGAVLPKGYTERLPSDATEINRHGLAQLQRALILITRVIENGSLAPESEKAARAFLGRVVGMQLTSAQQLVQASQLLERVDAQDEVQVALPSELNNELQSWLADYRKGQ